MGRTHQPGGQGQASSHSLVRARRLTGFTRWESRFRPEFGDDGRYVIVAPLLETTRMGSHRSRGTSRPWSMA
ncbi:MAG: hypothetical protein R3C32_07180 [Chloroflexota bacterium]